MNRYNPDIHHRRSIRLKGYDYTQAGAYFVTICTHDRECLFGEIVDGEMRMNRFGEMVENAWNDLPNHYRHLETDRFIVMPNHVHGVVVLGDDSNVGNIVGAGFKPAPTDSGITVKRHGLPELVRALKTFSARRINEIRNSPGMPVWQRNYFEHVIRNDVDYNRIAEYVATNPQRWNEDKWHPDNFVDGGKGNNGDNGNLGGNADIVGAGLKPAPTNVPHPGGGTKSDEFLNHPGPIGRSSKGT